MNNHSGIINFLNKAMGKGKILIVLTNCDKLGDTGHKTGWYLPEVAHPYHVFKEANFDVEFLSPLGGKAPMDPGSGEQFASDPQCQAFLANKEAMGAIENTKTTNDVKASDYKAIFYAGGHGPMFDLADCKHVAELCTEMYELGKIVGAVCHGTVGLLNVKLKNGDNLIKGHKVTSFTDAEENAVNLMSAMPFPLETKLKENGADFQGAENFACNTVVSGSIITGQNPASATETAQAIVAAIEKNHS